MKSNLIICIILLIVFIGTYYFIDNYFTFEPFSNPPKIAVITSIYGGYDELKEQHIKNKDQVDWYCFTDNANCASNGWTIITTPYHKINETDDNKHFKNSISELIDQDKKTYNMMSAKYYKIKTHEIDILKKYDYFIWTDGSLYLRDHFIENVQSLINKGNELIHFKHSVRTNISDEVEVSIKMKKYASQNILEQQQVYVSDGFKDDVGLFENTAFIRKNDEKRNRLFDEWWLHNIKYSFQDQISYPYVIWKTDTFPDYVIQQNVFNNPDFTYSDYSKMTNH
jgi:hypothetical protein